MIDRRQFLGCVTAAANYIAEPAFAQTPGRTYRVAVISPSPSPIDQFRQAVVPELAKLGFVEGRNLIITTHMAGTRGERTTQAIASRPDVLIASTTDAIREVISAAPDIPIVMSFIGEDPVQIGFAASFARPGGRITGLTIQAYQLDGKRLSILVEAAPAARRIGILTKRPPRHVDTIVEVRTVAKRLGRDVVVLYADTAAEYGEVFAMANHERVDAMVVAAAAEFVDDAGKLARFALDLGIPTIGESADSARGGLMLGYGPNRLAFRRLTADYIAKILNGTPAGDLPIQQPTEFELTINQKSARALGLTIPQSILVRADEIIE